VHVGEDAHGGEGQQHGAGQDQSHDPGCRCIHDRDGDAASEPGDAEDKQADPLKPLQANGETVAMAGPSASYTQSHPFGALVELRDREDRSRDGPRAI
jgi:hypothetical protein